jgi:hypothetical protein
MQHIAICKKCRIWTLHYFFAFYLAYSAYCLGYCSIFFDIFCIFCILQYAKYAEYEPCTIFLHFIWHIVHYTQHIYASICKIICNPRQMNMQNLNTTSSAGFIFCILVIYMQSPLCWCRDLQGSAWHLEGCATMIS